MLARRAFTLMELLVVLLIIGVLSSVAIRTIDATRNRGLFDQTTEEMKELVKAMTGNPEYVMDGRRVDFGFFGDMGRLPEDLRELVENTTGSRLWKGPYIRRQFAGDSVGFLYDAWGHPYSYDRYAAVIRSLGDGDNPMTVRIVDTLPQLYSAQVVGTVSDVDGNPPEDESGVQLELWVPKPQLEQLLPIFAGPMQGGYYKFPAAAGDTVPAGVHRLVARFAGDSIVRWVTVAPGSKTVVDFKFSQPFRNFLKMVGQPVVMGETPEDSSGFRFHIVNENVYDVEVDTIFLAPRPTDPWPEWHGDSAAYFQKFQINGVLVRFFPPGGRATRETVVTDFETGSVVIPGNRGEIVPIDLLEFYPTDTSSVRLNVFSKDWSFRIRFDDGSAITVRP